jgi:dihydropteroate synthase
VGRGRHLFAARRGLPLAVDATSWSGPEAVGREAAAVALGCRVIRTADVRRSRRVAEVMGALLAARREEGA